MRPILRTFWRDLAYHLLGLPATILAFVVVVAGLTVLLSALGIIIGVLLVLPVFAVFRWTARLERRRTAWALGEPVPEAYRPRRGGTLRKIRTVLGDPQTWKDLAWLAFAGSFGFVAAVVAITLWGTVLGVLFMPAWYWSLPEPAQFGLFEVDSLGTAFLATDLALVAIPVVYVLERWKTEGMLRLGKALLSPSREAALSARVEELAVTRAGAVDAAAAELQRIERDL
ncbi:MAG: sensor domain-containing protein, partial [Solirubrobacteraceae bacterium]